MLEEDRNMRKLFIVALVLFFLAINLYADSDFSGFTREGEDKTSFYTEVSNNTSNKYMIKWVSSAVSSNDSIEYDNKWNSSSGFSDTFANYCNGKTFEESTFSFDDVSVGDDLTKSKTVYLAAVMYVNKNDRKSLYYSIKWTPLINQEDEGVMIPVTVAIDSKEIGTAETGAVTFGDITSKPYTEYATWKGSDDRISSGYGNNKTTKYRIKGKSVEFSIPWDGKARAGKYIGTATLTIATD